MAPQKIQQWKSGQDGLDKLYMEEADLPTPGEDEVLIEIHSVSLNYRDTEGTSSQVTGQTLARS
jgi:NADPH:quinone reductase-like Zn-dependent oxidoreductase